MSTKSTISTAVSGRRGRDRPCFHGNRRAVDRSAGQGRHGQGYGEVLRGRHEGAERLCRRPGHHLPGHLDDRLPGQCLEVRRWRDLCHDGTARAGATARPRHLHATSRRKQKQVAGKARQRWRNWRLARHHARRRPPAFRRTRLQGLQARASRKSICRRSSPRGNRAASSRSTQRTIWAPAAHATPH